jgi:hypothetical protein
LFPFAQEEDERVTPLRPEPLEIVFAAVTIVTFALCLVGVVMVLRGRWTATQGIVWIVLALLLPIVGPLVAWLQLRRAERTRRAADERPPDAAVAG